MDLPVDIDWGQVMFVGIVIAIAILLVKVFRGIIHRYFLNESAQLKNDATNYRFLNNAVSFIIALAALIIIVNSVPSLKALSITLLAGAGIFAAIIGFASQAAFSNIISGVFIVIFKPFRVGDRIKVTASYQGDVEDITLRHTVIRDFHNNRIIIPNSVISAETVVNRNIEDERNCYFFEVGIAYDADVDKAIQLIREEAEKHPLLIDGRTQEDKSKGIEKVVIRVINFGDSSVNLRAYVWASSPANGWQLFTDMNLAVKKRFDQEGVEIPFPYRTLVFKNPETGEVKKLTDKPE